MLAVVLVSKSVLLVRSAIDIGDPAALIAASWAGGADAPMSPEKPGVKPGDHVQAAKPGNASGNAPGNATEPPTATDARLAPNGPPPITDGEKAVLLELRDRRQGLEARETALAGRESMLAAAEQKLSARIEELQSLQKRLESLDASHRQQEDSAWLGLVKVYETMKPRDAAVIFNDLGMPVLLAVVGRMKDAKTAAILAAMSPDKARDVTTQLAQARTNAALAIDTGGKPARDTEPGKPPGSGT
jgi:flagellar motility protein MotE (MotC chaperone)